MIPAEILPIPELPFITATKVNEKFSVNPFDTAVDATYDWTVRIVILVPRPTGCEHWKGLHVYAPRYTNNVAKHHTTKASVFKGFKPNSGPVGCDGGNLLLIV